MTPRPLSAAPLVPFLDDRTIDQHERLHTLRRLGPLVRTPFGGVLFLKGRHLELINEVDTRQIEDEALTLQGISNGPIRDAVTSSMLFSNGDVHRRRRGALARRFAPQIIAQLRPSIRTWAESLLETLKLESREDFLDNFANRLPTFVIAKLIGLPENDLDRVGRWASKASELLDVISRRGRADVEGRLTDLDHLVAETLQRHSLQSDSWLGSYANEANVIYRLKDSETRSQIVSVLLAARDTTCSALCMTFANIYERPDQWELFQSDPERLKAQVVSEGLRFDPPVAGIPRICLRDIVVDDFLIPTGTPLAFSLLSALRDLDVYKDPDLFDISRRDHPKPHPAFGLGAHRCLGEALARVQLEEALAALASYQGAIRITQQPRLLPGSVRRVEGMQVSFAA